MTRLSGTLVLLVLPLLACAKPDPRQERIVERWLLCDECVDGELDSLLALRERGQTAMIQALDGPPKERVENIRLQAEDMYDGIPNPVTPRQKFVDHYLSNHRAIYQIRAAVALNAFHTATAHAALVEALRHEERFRADVLRRLSQAAGVILSIFEGDSQHAELNFAVRTNPTLLVSDTVAAQAVNNVRVTFHIDSGAGSLSDSVRHTAPDGKASTEWKLGPADSINTLRAVAAGQVVRFHALGHPRGSRIVFLVQPSSATRGLPMSLPPRIAVQDAWGETLTGFNQNADVSVVPAGGNMMQNITNGEATLSGLTVTQSGTGFRLRVSVINLPPAYSAPFDVAP
jgi:hypothetical protein